MRDPRRLSVPGRIRAFMCNNACIQFILDNLSRAEAEGKRVLEAGSLNVNGSAREAVLSLSPRSYTGVDITGGPGVDEVCDVTGLVKRFGPGSFDLVLSTEMLEHVRDWRSAVSNLKTVLKPGGILLLTTRSSGYPYHGYPYDFWRYGEEEMRVIFADMSILAIAKDPLLPGIFVKAVKPEDFREKDLSSLELYSIISGRRQREITGQAIALFKVTRTLRWAISAILPESFKRLLKKLLCLSGSAAER